ncbi:MAG: MFS transporter [Halieaceae bacterium]
MSLYLSHSSRLRYAVCALLYFAQGIPYGLFSIAMPAWLASQDVAAGAIASYLAVLALPWAFKLLSGPIMDRYGLPAMGGRRPWILAAQLGMAVSFLGLTTIADPSAEIGMLMTLGALVNVFAATQDVAVDGMAIDLVPEAEHGRINAFMSCGKAVGWATTSAISGIMLVNYGLGTTAITAALVSLLLWCCFLLVREREGEKLLPWTAGTAHSALQPPASFSAIKTSLNQVLWVKTSLAVLAIMLLDGVIAGYGQALMPIAAVKVFNYSTEQWSQLVAGMGLAGAFAALLLGPMIDRIGAKRMLQLTVVLVAVHAFLLGATQHLWNDSWYVRLMLSMWVLMNPVVMVCVIALAMSICSSGVSATQFAIYMSTANLGTAIGSKLFGLISESLQSNFSTYYLVLGALLVLLLALVTVFRKDPKAVAAPG